MPEDGSSDDRCYLKHSWLPVRDFDFDFDFDFNKSHLCHLHHHHFCVVVLPPKLTAHAKLKSYVTLRKA